MSDPVSIYRLYGAADSKWLTWQTDVDVAPGPIADTSDFRIYYTGDGTPKKTNWAMASSGAGPYPADSYALGVPAPTAAPTLALSAGASVGTELRAYIYTFVSTFGSVTEESAPSPAAQISVTASKQVDISALQTAPAGDYNITHKRIYRSVTGATSISYELVAEVAIAATTYSDNLLVAALGEVIPSIGWLPPPDDLKGLVSLPCGSLAGFSGNTVYFSEPFFPHAWPVAYGLSIPHNIIGLGVYGSSIVVMTDRFPFVISGPYPGAYQVDKITMLEPCVSKASIVSDEIGVLYASPNGLVGIGDNVRAVLTGNLFRRDEWQAQLPTQIKGATYDGKYFAFYPSLTDAKTMVISRDDVPALSFLDVAVSAAFVDSGTSRLFFASATDSSIYELDADEVNPSEYTWLSKRFVLPQAISWSAMRLDADYAAIAGDAIYDANVAAIQAQNAILFAAGLGGAVNASAVDTFALNGDALLPIPTISGSRYAQVLIYGDGELVAVLSMATLDPVRLPAFRARELEIKIIGNINVRSCALATSVLELRTTE